MGGWVNARLCVWEGGWINTTERVRVGGYVLILHELATRVGYNSKVSKYNLSEVK